MIECISYCSTQTPQSQIDALTDLYTSTNGPSWTTQTNWLEGDPCSNQWFGVACNNASSVIDLFVFFTPMSIRILDKFLLSLTLI